MGTGRLGFHGLDNGFFKDWITGSGYRKYTGFQDKDKKKKLIDIGFDFSKRYGLLTGRVFLDIRTIDFVINQLLQQKYT